MSTFARFALLAALPACTQASTPASLSLAAATSQAPADGLSTVALTATVLGVRQGVVSFALTGPGLLSATNVALVDGVASVSLYAPFEEELAAAGAVETTVTATIAVDGIALTGTQLVTFTLPTSGQPVLLVRAEPDRVPANGDTPITVVVDGRRLSGSTVALSTSGPLGGLPSSLELVDTGDGLSHGELVIPPNVEPGEVTLTLRAEGAAPVDIVLRFTAEGEAAFDLNGTFAQVSYGVIEIGNLVFLNPDPQCVIAPTLSLVVVEQTADGDGTRLTLSTETCDIKMGDVNVHFIGRSQTHVDQSFVDAANGGANALSFTLADVGPGAGFDVPPEDFGDPLVVGAELADPRDPLPTEAEDARVRDDDGDGQPGVTIHNSTQDDQLTCYRTSLLSMVGTIESSDALRGSSEATTESVLFNGGGISPTISAKPSPWFMQRVDGRNGAPDIALRDGDPSSISCADIEAFAAELTAAAPAPSPTTACD